MKNLPPTRLLECVPNFSEGRKDSVIMKIQESIATVEGVKLLHIDKGYSANRTVMSFAGTPEAVIEAAFQSVRTASELIDMRSHKGTHPRIGACDVLPLVPLKGITMHETIGLSYILADRIGTDLKIPVYCYEKSAKSSLRKNLETIRKGEYEGLKEKILDSKWKPDYGPCEFNAKTGATIVGARDLLIAFNVNISTDSVNIAKEIASRIRKSGKTIQLENGIKKNIPGLLKSVKAIGWYIEDFQKVQVSMNITNLKSNPIHVVYETVKNVAKEYGVRVTGSELIGLIPEKVLIDAGLFYATDKSNFKNTSTEKLIQLAIEKMGLNEIKPFHPKERVIEYLLGL